jgi:hypothetical protein
LDGQWLFVGAKFLRKYEVSSGKLVGVLGEGLISCGVKDMWMDWKGENLISVHYDGSVILSQISEGEISEGEIFGWGMCKRYAPKKDTAVHWVEFIQDYEDSGFLLIDDGVGLKKLSIPGFEESSFGRSERFRVITKKAHGYVVSLSLDKVWLFNFSREISSGRTGTNFLDVWNVRTEQLYWRVDMWRVQPDLRTGVENGSVRYGRPCKVIA